MSYEVPEIRPLQMLHHWGDVSATEQGWQAFGLHMPHRPMATTMPSTLTESLQMHVVLAARPEATISNAQIALGHDLYYSRELDLRQHALDLRFFSATTMLQTVTSVVLATALRELEDAADAHYDYVYASTLQANRRQWPRLFQDVRSESPTRQLIKQQAIYALSKTVELELLEDLSSVS